VRLAELTFVTSNAGKLREAEAVLGVRLDHHGLDLPELQSLDLEEVVRHKARAAFERLRRPVLVEDTALELAGMGGFPGPLVRFLLDRVGPQGISTLAACFGDPQATARCITAAIDGETTVLGTGAVAGEIAASARGGGGFGWDSVFIPESGDGRTYAEMDDEAKNAISHRRRALLDLRRALGA
jgi:non-canonical purine NTP pyrophosphatase (RdgB/HAM1 family)